MKDYHIWLFVFGQEQNDVIFPGRLERKKKGGGGGEKVFFMHQRNQHLSIAT